MLENCLAVFWLQNKIYNCVHTSVKRVQVPVSEIYSETSMKAYFLGVHANPAFSAWNMTNRAMLKCTLYAAPLVYLFTTFTYRWADSKVCSRFAFRTTTTLEINKGHILSFLSERLASSSKRNAKSPYQFQKTKGNVVPWHRSLFACHTAVHFFVEGTHRSLFLTTTKVYYSH